MHGSTLLIEKPKSLPRPAGPPDRPTSALAPLSPQGQQASPRCCSPPLPALSSSHSLTYPHLAPATLDSCPLWLQSLCSCCSLHLECSFCRYSSGSLPYQPPAPPPQPPPRGFTFAACKSFPFPACKSFPFPSPAPALPCLVTVSPMRVSSPTARAFMVCSQNSLVPSAGFGTWFLLYKYLWIG